MAETQGQLCAICGFQQRNAWIGGNGTHVVLVPDFDHLAICADDTTIVLLGSAASEPLDRPHGLSISLILDGIR